MKKMLALIILTTVGGVALMLMFFTFSQPATMPQRAVKRQVMVTDTLYKNDSVLIIKQDLK